MAFQKIHGVIPPMLTPFRENGDIDLDAHIGNLKRWNNDDLAGYLVLGSNSETAYLNESEKLRLIEATAGNLPAGKILLAGTGLESTRETIRLTNLAADLGAHAALILTPCYYGAHMSDEALTSHFRHVADAVHIPVLIYNVPVYTHLAISVSAVKVLSQHPNIIGMKESTTDAGRIGTLLSAVPESFNIISGSAAVWYPALTLGIKAGILAISNFAAKHCIMIQKQYEAGENEKAKEVYLKLLPVNTAVTATYGIPGLKCAAGMLGYEPGFPRSPLLPLGDPQKENLRAILTRAGLLPQF